MRRRILFLGSAISALTTLPLAAFAASSDFFGPIIPQSGSCVCPHSAMDWGCVLQVLQNLLNAGESIAVLVSVLSIAVGGFALITSGSKPLAREKAKNRILNSVLGLAVVLGSWLMVDTVMKLFYDPNTAFEGGTFGPWNSLTDAPAGSECIKPNNNPLGFSNGNVIDVIGGIVQDIRNPGTSGSSSGFGTCKVQSVGSCAASNFTSTFGAAADAASQICSAESCAGSCLEGDKTTKGYPVSFGLFQINITAHNVAGLPCPEAFDSQFTGSHHNVEIVKMNLYKQCRAAALDKNNNAAVAASIYNKDNKSFRQWSTHKKCGLSYGGSSKLIAEACTILTDI